MDHTAFLDAVVRAVGDFFTFRTFISPGVLAIVYYVGAISMPVFAWLFARQMKERLATASGDTAWARNVPLGAAASSAERLRPLADARLSLAARLRVAGAALLSFVLMEIGWRVFFEFLLAYFQMREALVGVTG